MSCANASVLIDNAAKTNKAAKRINGIRIFHAFRFERLEPFDFAQGRLRETVERLERLELDY